MKYVLHWENKHIIQHEHLTTYYIKESKINSLYNSQVKLKSLLSLSHLNDNQITVDHFFYYSRVKINN